MVEHRRELLRQVESGDIDVEQAFRQVLTVDPHDYIALLLVGRACEDKGEVSTAQNYYWRALAANPCQSETYTLLWQSLTRNATDPELAHSLSFLAIHRMLQDPDRSDRVVEKFLDNLRGQLSENSRDVDPETLAAAILKLALARPGEPERVTEELRPLRLIQELIDVPSDGIAPETVQAILGHGTECKPLLTGIVRGWARESAAAVRPVSAEAALALLGEIGDPALVPDLLEIAEAPHDPVAEAATWAAWRIAERRPEVIPQLEELVPPDPELTVEDFCCVPPYDEQVWDEDEALEFNSAEPSRSRPARPGRNDPCWCGSGKKYKKCHLAEDERRERDDAAAQASPEEPLAQDARVSRMLIEFFQKHVETGEMKRALKLFFGGSPPAELSDTDQISFFDWVLNDFPPRRFGRPVTEEFLDRNRETLSAEDRAALEDWLTSRYSLFEVQRVEPGTGAELKDLLLGGTFFVHDVSTSRTLVQWDCLLSRVRNDGDRKVFTAVGLRVPLNLLPGLHAWILADREASGLDWIPYLRANSHRLRNKCLQMAQEWQDNLQIRTPEGDEVVFSKATFQVLDRQALLNALEASPVLGAREEENGAIILSWFETPESGNRPRRVLGNLRVEGDELVLECVSRQRLERGTALIRELAGESVKERLQDFQSLNVAMRNRPRFRPNSSTS